MYNNLRDNTCIFKLQFVKTLYLLIFEIWSMYNLSVIGIHFIMFCLHFWMGEWAANFCRNGFLKSKLNETDFNGYGFWWECNDIYRINKVWRVIWQWNCIWSCICPKEFKGENEFRDSDRKWNVAFGGSNMAFLYREQCVNWLINCNIDVWWPDF